MKSVEEPKSADDGNSDADTVTAQVGDDVLTSLFAIPVLGRWFHKIPNWFCMSMRLRSYNSSVCEALARLQCGPGKLTL